jgi:hypothetical protein
MNVLFAHSRPPVLFILGLAALTLGLPSSMDRVRAQAADVKLFPPPEVQVLLENASTGASEALAASLGVTEIGGKSRIGAPGHADSPRLRDVPVGVTSNDENEPTVVASPTDLKYLVAGSHSFPIGGRNRCAVYTSNDSGASWTTGATMPQLTATSSCSDPVLAYAPDGSRVFYSYMDIKSVQVGGPPMFTITTDLDIVVSYSDDNGATWSSAVIALNGDPYTVTYSPCPSPPFPPGSFCGVLTEPGYAFDKNWIGTHSESGDSSWVYVTATRFDTPGPSNIAFTQSSNSGLSYGPHQILDSGSTAAPGTLVQGSHPAGAPDGGVVVAWYHSGSDGIRNGTFQIRTRYSSDHGLPGTWGSRIAAVTDTSEAPFWLGPHTFYKRWWGTMFPDLAVDAGGTAHIVYTHDPVANGTCTAQGPSGPVVIPMCSSNPEDGDIRYIASAGAPYDAWSGPHTVNDDGGARAQGYPGLVTQHGGQASTVHIVWEDTRLSPDVSVSPIEGCFFVPIPSAVCNSPNLYYDIFYARGAPGHGVGFFNNFRVSEVSSIQDFVFTGDYTDLAANNRLVFGIWTDRRHQTTIFSGADNIVGSGVIPGGGAP